MIATWIENVVTNLKYGVISLKEADACGSKLEQ